MLTVYDFLNTNEILETLNTLEGIKKFKLQKASVFKTLPPIEKRKYRQVKFNSTNIVCIKVTPDLFIVDCDNLHTFNTVKKLLELHKVETLTTKSPYGGHFYFKRKNGEYIPDCTPSNKSDLKKTYSNPLDYYSKAAILDIQFFTSDTRQNTPVFDGNNNGYYTRVSETDTISELPNSLYEAFKDLASSYTMAPSSVKAFVEPLPSGKIFTYSKTVSRAIKNWVKIDDISEFEFLSLYHDYDPDFSFNNISNRNETLNRIAFWAGRSGFLSDRTWQDFVLLMYEQYFSPLNTESDPFTLEEVKRTILKPGKFSQYFHTAEETKELIQQRNIGRLTSKANTARSFIASGKTEFLALNPIASGDSNRFLYFSLNKGGHKFVAKLSRTAALNLVLSTPSLKDDYLKTIQNKKTGESTYTIDETNCFYANYVESTTRASTTLFSLTATDCFTIDFSYFKQNPAIQTSLEKLHSGNYDVEDITKRFEKTYYHYVSSKNFFYNKPHRQAKFEGDLGTFLTQARPLHSMPIFRDDGGTGKDTLLANLLTLCLYGVPSYQNMAYQSYLSGVIEKELYSFDVVAPASPDLLLGNSFNALMESRAVIFSETGGEVLNKKNVTTFVEKMKSYVSTQYIQLHKKGKDPISIANNKYYAWFTNYPEEIIQNKKQNRRFYILNGIRNVDVRQPEERMAVYKKLGYDIDSIDFTNEESEIWSVMKQDEQAILDYLLIVAPFRGDYCGYSTLPFDAMADDEFLDEESSFEDLTKDDSSSAIDYAKSIINEFTTYDGTAKIENIKKYAVDARSELRQVATIFAELCYRQLKTEEFIEFDTQTYYSVKQLTDEIMKVPTIDSFKIGGNEARKYLNREIKIRLVKSPTKTTSSKLTLTKPREEVNNENKEPLEAPEGTSQ